MYMASPQPPAEMNGTSRLRYPVCGGGWGFLSLWLCRAAFVCELAIFLGRYVKVRGRGATFGVFNGSCPFFWGGGGERGGGGVGL